MKSLVIGFGSIGQRHSRILQSLGHEVSVVTSQPIGEQWSYKTVLDAFECSFPDYVVVASPTTMHRNHLQEISATGFLGPCLIEKPLFVANEAVPDSVRCQISVGYNLRFLNPIQRLRHLVSGQQVISATFTNVEFLPNWRPGRDYRLTSSAQRASGGGVLRDLSHEVDFIHYLLDTPSRLVATLSNSGSLEIDTEDTVHALLETRSGVQVLLRLSYLDRIRTRTIDITTSSQSIHCNLLTGQIVVNGHVENHDVDRDLTFTNLHQDVLSGESRIACSLPEAVRVLRTIEMMEISNATNHWIEE